MCVALFFYHYLLAIRLSDDVFIGMCNICFLCFLLSAIFKKKNRYQFHNLNQKHQIHVYFSCSGQSNERQFLKDFVSAAPGSSGARLGAWLQPEPRLDPNHCELKVGQDPFRFGWPNKLQVITRDQYGDTVYIPNLKIEIKATPCSGLNNATSRHTKNVENPFIASTSVRSAPPPKVAYDPITVDSMCFKSITFMPDYEHYSFEELRLNHLSQHRATETIEGKEMGDQTFGALWTPLSAGAFSLTCTIDGVAVEEVYRVEVKDAGNPPPPQPSLVKKGKPQSKLRKFVARNSAGLRIRSHPTLQSEQLGIIKMDGIISFVDEQENDDGIWVRLSTESIRQHCTSTWYPAEAWCLQYNQHLGKTLLHPVVETVESRAILNPSPDDEDPAPLTPIIIRAGPNVPIEHGTPCKKPSINSATSSKQESPSKKPSKAPVSLNPFVFSQSPVVSTSIPGNEELLLLKSQADDPYAKFFDDGMLDPSLDRSEFEVGPPFEFSESAAASSPRADFDMDFKPGEGGSVVGRDSPNPSQIGTALAGVVGGGASKLQALHKWFKGDSLDGRDFARKKSELSELASVSVRDLVKAIGGQDAGRSNGNDNASSSPVPVPTLNQEPVVASSSKSTVTLESSFHRDLSPTSSRSSIKDDPIPSAFSFETQSESARNSQNDSTTTTKGLTPRSSPRKCRNKRRGGPIVHQVFEDDISGDNPTDTDPDDTKSTNPPSTTAKRALPSSLAESLRAVFAAFLWHEGIVHDAMACSSFLKFHPNLPKDFALLNANTLERTVETEFLSREQRAQQRYSVEVANAGNYLNIRPSTLETLTKSGNSSVLNRRNRKSEVS